MFRVRTRERAGPAIMRRHVMQTVRTAIFNRDGSVATRSGKAGIAADAVAIRARSMSPAVMSATSSASSSAKSRPAARWLRPVLGLLIPVLLAAGWEFAVYLGFSNGRLVPPPSRIFATFVELAQSGELWRHMLATTSRVAAGFALGVVSGTVLGALTGYSFYARRLLDPMLQALRAIPSIAWVPLFILWLGIFEASKVTLIAVGVFFPVYLGVMAGILAVDRKIVEVGRVFRLSGFQMVRRILLPAVLPEFITSVRSGLGLGWMFVVAAEFLGASEGLGYLLIDGQQLGKPAQIVAAIVAFAIIGKISDWIVVLATAPLLRWQDAFGGRQGGA